MFEWIMDVLLLVCSIYLVSPMPFFNQIMLAAHVHPYVDENVMFICIGHVWMDHGCVSVSL
jgi:hypothetical protein